MNELNFSIRYKDYEIRACPKLLVRLDPSDKNETVELLKYNDDGFCFTLLYFVKKSSGYELKFVGDRPFEYIDEQDLKFLWRELKHAQEILNEYFEMEGEKNE